ncbi:hypothetical protein [Chitinophaga sp.]|uniref:hypothetical protein n=1 Tax=Chitinophaga sp. TaxID=1869181 RepID=UPI0031D130CA
MQVLMEGMRRAGQFPQQTGKMYPSALGPLTEIGNFEQAVSYAGFLFQHNILL